MRNRGAISLRSNVISTSGLEAAILNFGNQPKSGNFGRRQTSDQVDRIIFKAGMVKNISHRSKAISTSGFVAAILNVGNQPKSGNIGSVRDVSGMVTNVGVAVEIASPAR